MLTPVLCASGSAKKLQKQRKRQAAAIAKAGGVANPELVKERPVKAQKRKAPEGGDAEAKQTDSSNEAKRPKASSKGGPADDSQKGAAALDTSTMTDANGQPLTTSAIRRLKRKAAAARKKEGGDDGAAAQSAPEESAEPAELGGDEEAEGAAAGAGGNATRRFIVFVGNLPFRITADAVKILLSAREDSIISVRMPTDPTTKKPKGFAFVEFADAQALRFALRMHHTELGGRKINVELTAGGGGKSEARKGKIQERNQTLTEERTKRIEQRKAALAAADLGAAAEEEE